MQCTLLKSDEFKNSYSLIQSFFLNPDCVASCSLCSNNWDTMLDSDWSIELPNLCFIVPLNWDSWSIAGMNWKTWNSSNNKRFVDVLVKYSGEQGWCSGESAHLPPMCPGLYSRTQRHVGWVCCWFSSLLWEVFLRVLWFSPLLMNKVLNSNLIWIIVKHFIISPWLGWLRRHCLCLTLNSHLHFIFTIALFSRKWLWMQMSALKCLWNEK